MPVSFLANLNWDALIAAAAWLAARTDTKVDDALVELIKAIREDATVQAWFGAQVEYAETQPPGTLSFTAEPPAEVVEALRQRGIFKTARDAGEIVSTIKDLLPYLVEAVRLIRLFTGK
jgi:dTDP-4-dehydrorhamnose reductase